MTTPPAAPVQFAFGEVRHARHRPVVNRFRFFNRDDRGVARIDYSDRDGPILDTSLSGRFVPADRAAALHAFLGYPLFSLAVIGRIHWQAARLWWQRVPFVRKPPPPQASVSRGPASSGPKAPHPTTLHP